MLSSLIFTSFHKVNPLLLAINILTTLIKPGRFLQMDQQFAKMHPRRLELGTLLKDRDDQQPAEWTIRIYNFISIFVIFK